jgi:hypothetical protein
MTRMKRVVTAGIVSWSMAGAAWSAVPPAFFARPGGPATFVRADAVFRSAGEIDSSLVSPSSAGDIELYTQLPEKSGCVRLGPVLRDYPNQRPFASLEQASRSARLVMVASVTDRASGFSGSEAGTLLELQPQELLKPIGAKKEAAYFTFVPVGTFSLEGRSYCAVHPDYPALPEVEDQVVVFVRDPESFAGSFLPLYLGTDIVVIAKDGKVKASSSLGVPASMKKAGALRSIRRSAGQEQRP